MKKLSPVNRRPSFRGPSYSQNKVKMAVAVPGETDITCDTTKVRTDTEEFTTDEE